MYKRILVSFLQSNNIKSNFITVTSSKATFSSKTKLSSICYVCVCVCVCMCECVCVEERKERNSLCYLVNLSCISSTRQK